MPLHHPYVIPMSFLCHSNVIPCHSSRPPSPCHKVWRKILHRKVRLGDVTGMTPDWHFRHSMVILNLNDHQMEEWRRDDRDEIPPSQAHFLRNDLGVTRFCHSEVSPSFSDANEWDDFDHFPVRDAIDAKNSQTKHILSRRSMLKSPKPHTS